MRIIDYEPRYREYFEKLNRAWLEKYFFVEPVDEWVLTHPDEAILQDGGSILFAEENGQILGTVALRWLEPGVCELTKMAVDESFQGRGAGKLLCGAGIRKARELKAARLILFTNSILKNAIHIYHQLGFVDLPLQLGEYKRADTMMEYPLASL